MWTLKFTEVESGLLCSQAFSMNFEFYSSGVWTVVFTGIKWAL